MTTLAGRPTYVGTRRFANRPAEVRRPRHRAAEPALVILVAAAADAVRYAGRAAARYFGPLWAAHVTARVVGVLIVAAGFLLGGGALVIVEADAAPAVEPVQPMIVVTPSPTPFPGGWTFDDAD